MKNNPYLKEEKEIMDSLISAYNNFIKLEQTHPSHIQDFVNGIHLCQSQIMNRVLQRDYPETFPTYKNKSKRNKITVEYNKDGDNTNLIYLLKTLDTDTELNIKILSN